MIKIFSVLVFFFSTSFLLPQEKTIRSNSLYFELFGNAGLYSVNYERILSERSTLRAGISYFGILGDNIISIPIMFNYLLFLEKNLEIGVGPLFFVGDYEDFSLRGNKVNKIIGTSYIGYRDHDDENNILFRAGIGIFYSNKLSFTGGISIGFIF